jgi:hypothetical protein
MVTCLALHVTVVNLGDELSDNPSGLAWTLADSDGQWPANTRCTG